MLSCVKYSHAYANQSAEHTTSHCFAAHRHPHKCSITKKTHAATKRHQQATRKLNKSRALFLQTPSVASQMKIQKCKQRATYTALLALPTRRCSTTCTSKEKKGGPAKMRKTSPSNHLNHRVSIHWTCCRKTCWQHVYTRCLVGMRL